MNAILNDPLEILVVPHEVIEWQRKKGLLLKRIFPEEVKREREKGKFAIFHNKIRLRGLYTTQEEAQEKVEEIVGNKRKCIENKRVFKVVVL